MGKESSPRRAPRSAKKGVLFALLVIALSVASFAASGLVAGATDPGSSEVSCSTDGGCNPCDPSGEIDSSTEIPGCNPCDVQDSTEGGDTSGCNPCDVQGSTEGGDTSGCNPCDVTPTDGEGGGSGCNPCDVSKTDGEGGEGGSGEGCNPCDNSGEISSSTDGGEGGEGDHCVTYDATTQVIAEGDPGQDITNGSAPLGTTVHDEATVTVTDLSSTEDGGGSEVTQNVNFTLFPGLECTGDSISSEDVSIDAPDTVNSGSKTLAAGDYSYLATYTRTESDDDYTDSTIKEDDDTVTVVAACEPFTIDPVDPSVVTTILDSEDTAVTTAALGTEVRDTAAVSGVDGFDPTGDVSFDFYAGADCSGTPVAAGSASVDKSGVADGSDVTDPLAAGSYSYLAHYSGDSNYNAIDAACENLVIEQAASATTTIMKTVPAGTVVNNGDTVNFDAQLQDTANVSSENTSFDPTGTVTFEFFRSGDCSGTAIDAGTDVEVAAGSSLSDVMSLNAQNVQGLGASFVATYSGDANFEGSTGDCEFTGTIDVAGLSVLRPPAQAQVAAALAFTGSSSTPWALFGALLVGLGGLVIVATRRRGGATS